MLLFNSRRRLGAAAIGAMLFASACGTAATDANEAADSGASASESDSGTEQSTGGPGLPQLIGDTVAGARFDTSELAGQDVAVWFWAPW